jgi:PAS domain S-box-containing protein
MAALVGMTKEEVLGKTLHDVFPAEIAGRLHADNSHIMATGEPLQVDEVVTSRFDDVPRSVATIKFPLRDAQGNVVGLAGVATDVTARKRAEAEMHLLSAALNAAANAIVITDARGVIEWANAAFTTFTGYEVEEARGRTPGELLRSGRHDADFYRDMWGTIMGGRVWRGETINRRRDGTLYTEEMTITPLKDEAGCITHFIAVKQDITQRRQLEEQYRQAQRLESVGRLAGGIAHDFNNLLTVINGTAEMAALGLPPADPIRAELAHILEAGERAAALTRRLLAFSRRQVLRPEVVRLDRIVADISKMLIRLVGEDIVIVTQLDEATAPVLGDAGQLEQVIVNLTVNARDAMPRGGTLTFATGTVVLDGDAARVVRVEPGCYARLSVRDTGCGMDAETLRRIFEPFFTTKAVGEGSGLGLSTVYGIVTQSGGGITVRSEPGEGAQFEIVLPAATVPATGQPEADVAETAATGETVLLLDDEASLRSVVERMLVQAGYRVLAASSAGEAMRILAAHGGEVDLLLTDVVMPDMSGPELVQRIGASHPGMKVLYASGYADDTLSRHGANVDPEQVLNKPFTSEALLRKVRRALGR